MIASLILRDWKTNLASILLMFAFSFVNININFCCRIARGRGNNIVQYSYINAVANNSTWHNRIRQELTTIGLLDMYLSAANNTKHVDVVFFQRLVDIFHQTAFSQIREPQSKLRTYSLIKRDIGVEKYLSEIKKHK